MQKELKIATYIFLALVLCGVTACSVGEKSKQEVKPIFVHTQVVTAQVNMPSSRYVGTIDAACETPLSMQTAGRVLAVYVKDGSKVRKGQVLLRIDSTQAVNALRSAEASLHHAQDGYNRVKQVHEKGAVTDQKMVEIESQLVQARSLYQAAKQQVKECTLSAPCDGTISGMDIKVGQTVIPGVRVASILDVTAFSVRFSVPENEIGGITIGQHGTMECVALNDTFPIVVTEKSLKADPIAHAYEITALVTGGEKQLMAGMVGKVNIASPQAEEQNIIIPAQCILLMPQGATVWVLEQGKAQRRDVVVEGYLAEGVQIKEGLQAGDTLIVDGYQKLYKNCPIAVQ